MTTDWGEVWSVANDGIEAGAGGTSRRRFLHNSVGAGTLALFGLGSLDALVSAVSERIAEREGMSRVGHRVVDLISTTPSASADDYCVP